MSDPGTSRQELIDSISRYAGFFRSHPSVTAELPNKTDEELLSTNRMYELTIGAHKNPSFRVTLMLEPLRLITADLRYDPGWNAFCNTVDRHIKTATKRPGTPLLSLLVRQCRTHRVLINLLATILAIFHVSKANSDHDVWHTVKNMFLRAGREALLIRAPMEFTFFEEDNICALLQVTRNPSGDIDALLEHIKSSNYPEAKRDLIKPIGRLLKTLYPDSTYPIRATFVLRPRLLISCVILNRLERLKRYRELSLTDFGALLIAELDRAYSAQHDVT